MKKGRLEAFSDGVIAIIITIMVLEMKHPEGTDFEALRKLVPVFVSYLLSYIYIAIYWNNHHHLIQAVEKVNGATLWANMHLLFWLSLTPFVTDWMGENHTAALPVACYGIILLFSGIAYLILVKVLIKYHGKDSIIAKAIGKDYKGIISIIIYIVGAGLSYYNTLISLVLYYFVAIIWLIPDKRIEKRLIS
jgi:uncharacterized membrane protein